jgi:hypothetical protein
MPDTWYDLFSSYKKLAPVARELSEALSSEDVECEDISTGLTSPEALMSLLKARQKLPALNVAQEYSLLACLKQLGGEQQPRCCAFIAPGHLLCVFLGVVPHVFLPTLFQFAPCFTCWLLKLLPDALASRSFLFWLCHFLPLLSEPTPFLPLLSEPTPLLRRCEENDHDPGSGRSFSQPDSGVQQ